MNTFPSLLRMGLYGVAVSALSLAACSNPSSNSDSNNTSAESTEAATEQKAEKDLAITAIVEHPSLDAIRAGVIDELAELGYVEGQNLNINFQSAQGNTATAGQISKQFVADAPDAIVAISTPSAQSMVAATKDLPILYTAVSDPVAAKLIDANNTPIQTNVSGLSSEIPLEPQIDLILQIKPDAKTIGYVYSPGEANSVAVRDDLKALLPKRGMTLLDVPANRPTDIGMATRSLQGRADVIYTSLDNNVVSAFESLALAADELDIPVIASDEFSVQRGAAAALGVNDHDFGRVTGKMVAQILDGTPISDIQPQVMNELTLYVSPSHAEVQGITLPQAVLDKGINVDEKTTAPAN